MTLHVRVQYFIDKWCHNLVRICQFLGVKQNFVYLTVALLWPPLSSDKRMCLWSPLLQSTHSFLRPAKDTVLTVKAGGFDGIKERKWRKRIYFFLFNQKPSRTEEHYFFHVKPFTWPENEHDIIVGGYPYCRIIFLTKMCSGEAMNTLQTLSPPPSSFPWNGETNHIAIWK